MTTPTPPGWYPDPYGTPGLLRYWDGARWTDQAHYAPGDAPGTAGGPQYPGTMGPAGPTGPTGGYTGADPWGGPGQPWGGEPIAPTTAADHGKGRGPATAWLFGGIGALAVIVVAVSLLAVTGVFSGGGGGGTPTPDDTSASPLGTPTEPGTASAGQVTDPTSGIAYDRPSTSWNTLRSPTGIPGKVEWSNAVGAVAQTDYRDGHNWIANVFTGAAPDSAPYTGVGALPALTKGITRDIEANNYNNVGSKTLQVLDSKSVEVDGHRAWLEKFKYTYNEADQRKLSFKTETAAVICVDRAGKKPAVLYISVPDNFDTGIVDRTLRSIKVNA